MKNLIFLAACFVFFNLSAQDPKPKFDGKKWEAPYNLDFPKGWDVERFLIPIEFAPSIPYNGVEDIRFTPGWGKKESAEYWSYVFLWYLDGTQKFDSKVIGKNLLAYYTGLINVNIDKTKIDTTKIPAVKVLVKTKTTQKGDLKTFEGTVNMFDYMTQKPIKLNLLIHVKSCPGNKTFVFHEVSPMPYSNEVWKSLDQLWSSFKCSKE